MQYRLLKATRDHLRTLLPWIRNPNDLKFWGGSALTYPPEVERTWQEIGADDENSFVLVDPAGNTVGFGQALARPPDTVHLGRIIVDPALRGQGLGSVLCGKLIEAAIARHRPGRITLNVYRSNAPACKLYTALGFSVSTEDPEHDSVMMVLNPGDFRG